MHHPTEITPVDLAPRLEALPTQNMKWENLELLLRRILQETQGSRIVKLYGVRGQKQHGIDVAGIAVDGSYEAVQTKRYQTFTKDDLTAAVTKFLDERNGLPFTVSRLFVAAACDADRTEITDELYRLNEKYADLEIVLWDCRTICDMLRSRRDIVTEFFGETAAELFCLPGEPHVVTAAPPPTTRSWLMP